LAAAPAALSVSAFGERAAAQHYFAGIRARMRRTARISAAYAPRGAGRIGAAPGDERARTGITEQEQQAAPASILAEAAARDPIGPQGNPRPVRLVTVGTGRPR
jgi:hypothetical protein